MHKETLSVQAVLSLYSLAELRAWLRAHEAHCDFCSIRGIPCQEASPVSREYWLRLKQEKRGQIMTDVYITVDEEFGADIWWRDAQAASDCPKELLPILHGLEPEVIVPADRGAAIEQWCKTIPGWNDGTAYASHPLLFNQKEEEDE